MEQYIKDAILKLNTCFPKGKVLIYAEPIEYVAHTKGNVYFILGNCSNQMEIDCKVIEWFSRAAYKTEPYRSDYKNKEFHDYFLKGINQYFNSEFSKDDIEIIYTYLGNACNHQKTIDFINSGFDMSILNPIYDKTTIEKEYE